MTSLQLPAGLPTTSPPPTRSFWQAFNDASPVSLDVTDHLHSPTVPEEADVVIVGSGISGSVAAYELLKLLPSSGERAARPSVVLLEARSACSGATGRNGGHCRPDAFAGYPHYVRMVGQDQARKVLLNEAHTLRHIASIVEDEDVRCDWHESGTCAAYLTEEARDRGKEAFEAYRKDWGDDAVEGVKWHEGEEAAKITRLPGCLSAALFPAASIWPLKFVHSLLSLSIARGLQLFTHTPVLQLHRDEATATWRVSTPRGSIRARKVLLATNGYSLALLPGLEDWIMPHRSQCSSHLVPSIFTRDAQTSSLLDNSAVGPLRMTYSIIKAPDDYEYLVQNASTGQFVLGGGHPYAPAEEQFGLDRMDDSVLLDGITQHLTHVLDGAFEGFGVERERERMEGRDVGVTTMWSGIQGYTRDSLPIVGHVPASLTSVDPSNDVAAEDSGLFACLGFQGHGMARASTCARGVARLIHRSLALDTSKSPAQPAINDAAAWEAFTDLPHSFRFTAERYARRDVDARGDV